MFPKMVSLIISHIFLTLLAAPALTQTPAPKQASQSVERRQDPVLRLTTEMVALDAQVVSKKTGAIVDGLKLEDFELYEDGVNLNDGIANVDVLRRKHKEKDTLRELYEAGATVCGVTIKSLKTYIMQGSGVPVESVLGIGNPAGSPRSYARKTGGEVISGKAEVAAEKLAEVFDHLRATYSLGYTPANTTPNGKFRRLKLRLTGKARSRVGEVIIRTRQGYYPRLQSSLS